MISIDPKEAAILSACTPRIDAFHLRQARIADADVPVFAAASPAVDGKIDMGSSLQ